MSALEENYSENEDDPQVYESSGDEWSSASEQKKRSSRRASQRLSKKPRVSHSADSSDSDSESPERKPKPKNGVNKRQKVADGPAKTRKYPVVSNIMPAADFVNGSFLIMKKDVQTGDPSKHPCIWRIDGKALLQKYEPFEDDGKIKHKNTSIYTGWSALDKDLYAPVTVKVHQHSNQQMIVELDWQKIKEIKEMDSD